MRFVFWEKDFFLKGFFLLEDYLFFENWSVRRKSGSQEKLRKLSK